KTTREFAHSKERLCKEAARWWPLAHPAGRRCNQTCRYTDNISPSTDWCPQTEVAILQDDGGGGSKPAGPGQCPKMVEAGCNQTCKYYDNGLLGSSRQRVIHWWTVNGLQANGRQW
ncbi:Hypothetical predicted protein, partial [Marmota monax]